MGSTCKTRRLDTNVGIKFRADQKIGSPILEFAELTYEAMQEMQRRLRLYFPFGGPTHLLLLIVRKFHFLILIVILILISLVPAHFCATNSPTIDKSRYN